MLVAGSGWYITVVLRWVETLKRRIETSGYGGRPITGVDLQPVKYGTSIQTSFRTTLIRNRCCTKGRGNKIELLEKI